VTCTRQHTPKCTHPPTHTLSLHSMRRHRHISLPFPPFMVTSPNRKHHILSRSESKKTHSGMGDLTKNTTPRAPKHKGSPAALDAPHCHGHTTPPPQPAVFSIQPSNVQCEKAPLAAFRPSPSHPFLLTYRRGVSGTRASPEKRREGRRCHRRRRCQRHRSSSPCRACPSRRGAEPPCCLVH